jgi:hypothetical protein
MRHTGSDRSRRSSWMLPPDRRVAIGVWRSDKAPQGGRGSLSLLPTLEVGRVRRLLVDHFRGRSGLTSETDQPVSPSSMIAASEEAWLPGDSSSRVKLPTRPVGGRLHGLALSALRGPTRWHLEAGRDRAGDRGCPACVSRSRRIPDARGGGPRNGADGGRADAYARGCDLRKRATTNERSGGSAGPPATRHRGPHSDCGGPCRLCNGLRALVWRGPSPATRRHVGPCVGAGAAPRRRARPPSPTVGPHHGLGRTGHGATAG